MARLIRLTVGLAFVFVSPAFADTWLVNDNGTVAKSHQRMLRDVHVGLPAGTFRVLFDGCTFGGAPHAQGCIDPAQPNIIHLHPLGGRIGRPSRRQRHFRRLTLLHELGHVWDQWYLIDSERLWIAGLWNLRGWGVEHASAIGDPAVELFAEAYAFCAAYPRGRRRGWASYVGLVDTSVSERGRVRALGAVCSLVERRTPVITRMAARERAPL